MIKVFTFWRFVISIGFAKSGTWAITTEKEQRVLLLSVHTVTNHNYKNCGRVLAIIIAPISLTIGYAG